MSLKPHMSKLYLFALITFLSFPAYAVDLVLEMGLHDGGDDLVTATFSSGDSETLEAGGLYHFSVGAGFDIAQDWVSRITFGIKEDSITASNGDIKFTRYPIDALFLYRVDQWMIGGGLTYHTGVELDGSGLASPLNADFDDALGVILEVDYRFGKAYVGGRYTIIDYDTVPSASVNAATVDGNSIGVVLGAKF